MLYLLSGMHSISRQTDIELIPMVFYLTKWPNLVPGVFGNNTKQHQQHTITILIYQQWKHSNTFLMLLKFIRLKWRLSDIVILAHWIFLGLNIFAKIEFIWSVLTWDRFTGIEIYRNKITKLLKVDLFGPCQRSSSAEFDYNFHLC